MNKRKISQILRQKEFPDCPPSKYNPTSTMLNFHHDADVLTTRPFHHASVDT